MNNTRINVASETEAPDFGKLPNFIGFLISRISNRVIVGLEMSLQGLDITVVGFVLLTLIHRNPGMSQVEVASALRVKNATVTGGLNRLERKALVIRAKRGKDKRQNALYLSKAGAELRARAERRLEEFETSVDKLYGILNSRRLKASLRRLDEGLTHHPYFNAAGR